MKLKLIFLAFLLAIGTASATDHRGVVLDTVPVKNRGITPLRNLRNYQTGTEGQYTAKFGQMVGVRRYSSTAGDTLMGLVPVYYLGDSTFKVGTYTVLHTGNQGTLFGGITASARFTGIGTAASPLELATTGTGAGSCTLCNLSTDTYGRVTSRASGTVNLGTQVSGSLPTTNGGTGFATYAVGDLLYASTTTALSRLAAGTNGYVLTLSGGLPTWAASTGESSTASNGLTLSSLDIKLGGTMTQNTTIAGAGYNWTHTGLNFYDFEVDSFMWKVNGNKFLHMGSVKGPTYNYASLSIGYRALNSAPTYGNAANLCIGSYAGELLAGIGINGASNALGGYTAGATIIGGSFNSGWGVAVLANAGPNIIGVTANGHHAGLNSAANYSCYYGQSNSENNTAHYMTSSGWEGTKANTTGAAITNFGAQGLVLNQTSSYHSNVGFQGMFVHKVGNGLTNNGYQGMWRDSSGIGNTNSGYQGQYFNKQGYYITTTGYQAGYYGVAVGPAYNTFNGALAGYGNIAGTSTGTKNTFNGGISGRDYTSGSDNSTNGYGSLQKCTTCTGNVADGIDALANCTTCNYNTAGGRQAGNLLVNGTGNLLQGYNVNASSTSASNEMNLGNSFFATGINANTALFGLNEQAPTRTWQPTINSSSATAIRYLDRYVHATSGAVGTGFGLGTEVSLENASGTQKVVFEKDYVYTDATSGSEDVYIAELGVINGTLTQFTRSTATQFIAGNYVFNKDATLASGDLMRWDGSEWSPASVASIMDASYHKQGGNSYAAAARIGTNDNNVVEFEANNVLLATMQTDGRWDLTTKSSSTGINSLKLYHDKSSTAADDDENRLLFNLDDGAGNETNYAQIRAIATNVANGSEAGAFAFNVIKAGVSSQRLFISDSYMSIVGDVRVEKTITPTGTTGAQTINTTAGAVNFAAAATSLVVTNSLVNTSSVIFCMVGTNDTTMKSVVAVPGSGSFTIYANAAPTAETRVYFTVIN